MKKKKRTVSIERCRHLYIDVFGHPYCTGQLDKVRKCGFFLISEEYLEMKKQLEWQKKEFSGDPEQFFIVPTTWKCTKHDALADSDGHLPEDLRPRLKGRMSALTFNRDDPDKNA